MCCRDERDETGATLILALIFLVVVSVIVGALASWVGNDLNNTSKFTSAQSFETAANDATEVAVQSVRYYNIAQPASVFSQSVNASPPTPCWTVSPALSQPVLPTGLPSMNVWCSTLWSPYSPATRTVTFSTCPTSVSSAATCALDPALQAVVVFDDYSYPLGVATSKTCMTTGNCGEGMNVQNWIFNPVVPTVTSISPASGSTSGGTSVTINGTSFVTGATVNFVETTASDNVVLAASSVVVNSSTQITVKSPAITTSTLTYYVTVITPEGTSAVGLNSRYTY
jgi:hypothetical protein